MGRMDVKWLFLVSLCWFSRISCFRLEQIDEKRPPENLQIDFYSNQQEAQKFLERFRHDNDHNFIVASVGTDYPQAEDDDVDEYANKQRMFVLFQHTNDNFTGGTTEATPLDHWSVVWYIASFGGLILFFLIVSCSEWCCRRAARNQTCPRASALSTPSENDTPPPSYDQFAPPSYDSICLGKSSGEKCDFDIYVVPVHAISSLIPSEEREEDEPPSYVSAAAANTYRNVETV